MVLLGLAGSGCASDARLQEELSRLRQELHAVRQDVAQTKERVNKLEGQVGLLALRGQVDTSPPPSTPARAAPARASASARISAPAAVGGRHLPIVRLGQAPQAADGWVEPGAQDDGSPPVEIKLGPSHAAPVRGGERLSVDHAVLKRPDPVLSRRRVSKQQARAQYRRALATLRVDKKPAEALKAFDAFLRANPRSDLADNATYWRGIALKQQARHTEAVKVFRSLLKRYPSSSKRPYARLQIGECWLATGKTAQAKTMLRQVVDLHPGSEAAKTAQERLGALEGKQR